MKLRKGRLDQGSWWQVTETNQKAPKEQRGSWNPEGLGPGLENQRKLTRAMMGTPQLGQRVSILAQRFANYEPLATSRSQHIFINKVLLELLSHSQNCREQGMALERPYVYVWAEVAFALQRQNRAVLTKAA